MNVEEFFNKNPRTLDIYCRKCSAKVEDPQQHYKWHRSVDSTATVEVYNNDHTKL